MKYCPNCTCTEAEELDVVDRIVRYRCNDCDNEYTLKRVKNLMSSKMIDIAVDTPFCCDPSTETYWSM